MRRQHALRLTPPRLRMSPVVQRRRPRQSGTPAPSPSGPLPCTFSVPRQPLLRLSPILPQSLHISPAAPPPSLQHTAGIKPFAVAATEASTPTHGWVLSLTCAEFERACMRLMRTHTCTRTLPACPCCSCAGDGRRHWCSKGTRGTRSRQSGPAPARARTEAHPMQLWLDAVWLPACCLGRVGTCGFTAGL